MITIKAILLDLYGTLAYIPVLSYKKTKEKMAAIVRCNSDEFMHVWRSLSNKSTLGLLASTEERIEATLSIMNIKASTNQIEEMAKMEIDLQEKEVQLIPGAIECIQEIRQMKFKLALVTNCSSSAERVPELLGIAKLMDVIILSFKEKVVKPDPIIYRISCHRLKTDPKFCIFAGDGDCHELDGAKKVGMTTVLVGGTEELVMHLDSSTTNYDYRIQSIRELPEQISMITK